MSRVHDGHCYMARTRLFAVLLRLEVSKMLISLNTNLSYTLPCNIPHLRSTSSSRLCTVILIPKQQPRQQRRQLPSLAHITIQPTPQKRNIRRLAHTPARILCHHRNHLQPITRGSHTASGPRRQPHQLPPIRAPTHSLDLISMRIPPLKILRVALLAIINLH